jgi:hypothetical protein
MLRVLDLQLGDPAFSLSALGFSDAKSTGFLLVSRTSGLQLRLFRISIYGCQENGPKNSKCQVSKLSG